MSIRVRLVLIVFVLSLGLIASLGWTLRSSSRELQGAVVANEANLVAAEAIAAGNNWAVERGTVNGLLADVARAPDTALKTVQDRRAAGLAAWARVQTLAAQPDITSAEVAQSLTVARAAIDRVERLRAEFDAAVAAKDTAGGQALRSQWFDATTAAIMAVQGVRQAVELKVIGTPATRLMNGLALKHALFTMSEFAGRERGFINGVIAANQPLSPAQMQQVGSFKGQIDASWLVIQARRTSLGPELAAAIAAFERQYFQEFLPLRDRVLAAGSQGQPYPVPAPEWFAASTRAIEAMIAAQTVVTRVNDALADGTVAFNRTLILIEALLGAGAVIVVLGALWVLSRHVVRPLRAVTAAVGGLAEGDYTTPVPDHNRNDEIGAIVAAVRVFRDTGLRVQAMEAEQAAQEQAEREKRAAELADLAQHFETSVKTAAGAVGKACESMIETATITAKRQERGTMRSVSVSEAAEATRTSISALASAGEEMAASIAEIGQQVTRAAGTARQASDDVSHSRDQIERLAEASRQIGSVVALITEIAEQTNLLALNATIEAARAGDAGRGFAVVANEVKALAGQTAQATAQITRQIEAIQEESRAAVDGISRVGDVVQSIDEMTGAVAAAVEQQGAVTNEIAETISRITRDMDQVAGSISDVTGGTIRGCASSIEVLWAGEDVMKISARLERDVDGFLNHIRRDLAA
ncbi:MAG: methyl-accepting chemotaxis protein [Alphaproteobacteria bacterium]|nr:MAG: methyl-accepting chemotaxis protein [Alphaproteobacteria bacterium]